MTMPDPTADPAVLSDARAQIEASAMRLKARARDYRMSVVGMKLGEAMFAQKMAHELDEEAKTLLATPPATDAPASGAGEAERLLQALRDVLDPIAAMQRECPPGHELNHAAITMGASLQYIQTKVRNVLAAAPQVASEAAMPFGLPLSDTDLTRLYEGSKRDALPVGSEVRQLVAEVRYHRGNRIPVAYLLTKAGSFEEFSRSPLTDADKADGWTETPLYARSGYSL